uniref:Uncharacterized protein n=1 Tax=Tanacetum cinerariifolium TaxID=118510 RepID=A0A6L2K1X9_TANCI|nr:hypothetical protein [Tanacetum cinerariifolium]
MDELISMPENMAESLVLLTNDIYPSTIEENEPDHTCSPSTEGDEPEEVPGDQEARESESKMRPIILSFGRLNNGSHGWRKFVEVKSCRVNFDASRVPFVVVPSQEATVNQ